MRKTLNIDEDVLSAANTLARREHKTVSQVFNELARSALNRSSFNPETGAADSLRRNLAEIGVIPFPARAGVSVTDEMVRKIRDEEGI